MVGYFAQLQPAATIAASVTAFLTQAGRPGTLAHIRAVEAQARGLAARFGANVEAASAAAWCHDIAAVVPRSEIIDVAEAWGVPLADSDRAVPGVIHGPLAAAVVQDRLALHDEDILNAIRHHTTLRAGASLLEKVVFIADKIALDPTAPRSDFVPAVKAAAKTNIDQAAFAYIGWVVHNNDQLGWVLHQNLRNAYQELVNLLE